MTEYKHGSAAIRIHGTYDLDTVKSATETFMKKVERKRKNERKKTEKENQEFCA